MAFKVEVWGDCACFTRPELKTERVSYDVMTPSAARGILDAIYWHPGMLWVVDSITVCNPIKFANLRRNELKSKISSRACATAMQGKGKGELWTVASEDRQQRATMMLIDVRYIIEAHVELVPDRMSKDDNIGKFLAIIERRLQKGQCYHQPCFGCREMIAHFKACEEEHQCPSSLQGEHDLGFMLYDMDYSDREHYKPLIFRAKMVDGKITVPVRTSQEVLG